MNTPSDRELRFRTSLRNARAYRKELIDQLIEKIEKEEKMPLKSIPVNYGMLGDIEFDICQLEQMLSIETK